VPTAIPPATHRARRCAPRAALAAAALLPALAACEGRPRSAGADTAAPAAAAAPSIAESLERFRAGLPAVTALAGGAPSRDSLVRRFARAVERRDTVALREMALSRAEFAYLYYPSTRYVRRPYELDPETLWFLSLQNSEKGIGRLLERRGGRPLGLVAHACADAPTVEGENRLHDRCVVDHRPPGADSVERRRLFGTIIERAGAFKFVSYANDY
jgi:hypothetical protein